jgi:SAM-dependent methyltransferase
MKKVEGFECLACGSEEGRMILDLGLQPLANNLLHPTDLKKAEPHFPLQFALCESCRMIQIARIVPPVQMFSDYPYFSSFSDTMLKHAAAAAERYRQEFKLTHESFVVELGSNDGYLLQNFLRAGIPCLGVDPAANVAVEAQIKGIATIVDFFGQAIAQKLAGQKRQADLILGNNVFAHAPLINDIVAGLKILLKPQGRIVIEVPYAMDLFEHTEFDTIYHEHVFYFTITALEKLLTRHNLTLFHVEKIAIHGGTVRLFVSHADAHPIQPSVQAFLQDEEQKGVFTDDYYQRFATQVKKIHDDLWALVQKLKADGKTIAAYGASAKGCTLLNFCGLGRDHIDFVVDRNTHKQNLLTPGQHIPIFPAEELLNRQPDYALLLTWNFAEEILAQQKTYRDRGGKFIIPVPEVKVV